MRVRQLRAEDAGRVYDLFNLSRVSREDLARDSVPKSGFYEYPHTAYEMGQKIAASEMSVALVDGEKVLAYLLAYPIEAIPHLSLDHEDPVLERLKGKGQVYADQFFLQHGLPVFLAGRLLDAWDDWVRSQGIAGVFGAIPQKPWRNISSTRFALCRGFSREGVVNAEGIELGLFHKPFLKVS